MPLWSHDDPLTLIKALLVMLRATRRIDVFVFNLAITSMGNSRLANGIGILLPSILRRLSGKPVLVYMHNFLETQDARRLGYNPGLLSRASARFLEEALLRFTRVIVPLQSQRNAIEDAFGIRVESLVFPYIEVVLAALALNTSTSIQTLPETTTGVRVLLFGSWGPQKDLEGALKSLHELTKIDPRLTVTIAGAASEHFKGFEQELVRLRFSYGGPRFTWVGSIPEEEVLPFMLKHDLLLLPYNATGGYSGAMNCAALAGTHIIAYDLPQLRESARELGASAVFIRPGDTEALKNAIDAVIRVSIANPIDKHEVRDSISSRLNLASDRVETLIERLNAMVQSDSLREAG